MKKISVLIFLSLTGCAGGFSPVDNHSKAQDMNAGYQSRIVERSLDEPYVRPPTDPDIQAIYLSKMEAIRVEQERTKQEHERLNNDRLKHQLESAKTLVKNEREEAQKRLQEREAALRAEAEQERLAIEEEKQRLRLEAQNKYTQLAEQKNTLVSRLEAVQEGRIDVSAAAKNGLTVFTVQPGSLKGNAERLLEAFGWELYRWEAADYPIDYSYSVQLQDLKQGLDFLLKPYPIQAQRIMANHTVLFIETHQKKN